MKKELQGGFRNVLTVAFYFERINNKNTRIRRNEHLPAAALGDGSRCMVVMLAGKAILDRRI